MNMTRTAKLDIPIVGVDEFINGVVKLTGNGAYVGIGKKYEGRKVKSLILKEGV